MRLAPPALAGSRAGTGSGSIGGTIGAAVGSAGTPAALLPATSIPAAIGIDAAHGALPSPPAAGRRFGAGPPVRGG